MSIPITFWSRCGKNRRDSALSQAQVDPAAMKFEGEGFYAGKMQVDASGTLVLQIESPRAIRLWLAGTLVLDESLYWRYYERKLWAAVTFPCSECEIDFLVEAGPRSVWHKGIDDDCPSRNREKVRNTLRKKLPDRLQLSAEVTRGARAPAVGIRFLPNQFRRDGVAYQQIRLRPVPGPPAAKPSIHQWSPSEAPQEPLWLRSSVLPCDATEFTHEADRNAGILNLFVPVANPQDDPPPLRKVGDAETRRVEPELEIVRHITLTLEGAHGEAQLVMPAFESLGRRAPVREYVKMDKPEFAAGRERLPVPIVPDTHKHFTKLYWYTWDMLYRLLRDVRPESGLPGIYCKTGLECFQFHQFVWDTSFTAMCTAYGFRDYPAYNTLNLLYSRQFDGGYINREHDIRDGMPAAYEPDFSPNPPIISVAERQIANLTGDKLRLMQVYPLLADLHRWLATNRRLPNGTYWTTGLASGLDNSPSLGDGYPDLTAQMAHDAEMLADIARVIGKHDEAEAWEAERRAIADAMNEHLWSESMQIFSTSLPDGGHNTNKVVTAFWPLWTGLVPPERVDALAQHLLDPNSFWRHHPLPSLAADSPHFQPEGFYWLGSVWAPTTYSSIKGFARAGRYDLARKAAIRHLDVIYEVFEDTGRLWENYCSEKSARGNQSSHDYCWTALGPIALLFEVVIGIQADALNNRIIWHLPDDPDGYGVDRFPLGSATVQLRYTRYIKNDEKIHVTADRRFTLEVIAADGTAVEYDVKPGSSVIDR